MIDRPTDNATPKRRLMNGFIPLFRKEMRFFMWPVIALFLVINVSQLISVMVIHYFFPDDFLSMISSSYNSMFFVLFLKPVIARGAMEYMYTTLFLFALIHEHTARSRDQLNMLPVRRMTQLAAKFCALAVWLVIIYMVTNVLSIIVDQILVQLHYRAYTSAHPSIEQYARMTIYNLAEVFGILSVTAIGMLGYVATVSVRRFRIAVGSATVFIGFTLMSRYVEVAEYFFRRDVTSVSFSVGKMYDYSTAYYIVPNASAVIVLVALSLVLYEKFGRE